MERTEVEERVVPVASRRALEAQARELRGDAALQPEVPRRTVREYLDTFDFRVHRAGWSLSGTPVSDAYRLRWSRESGVALEAAIPGRPSGVQDLPPAWREAFARRLEPRALLPRIRVEGRGRSFRALDAVRKTVARLHAETLTVTSSFPEKREAIVPVWRVQPLRGYARAHRHWLERVRSAVGEGGEPRDEYGWALEVLGLAPESFERRPVPLDPGMPVADASERVFSGTHHRMTRQIPGMRADLDIEFLHDFRVSVRRTRSWIKDLAAFLPEDADWTRAREDFRRLGRMTNPVRDLDVWRWRLGKVVRDEPSWGADLAPLAEYLAMLQRTAHVRMIRELDAIDAEGWERHWRRTLERLTLEAPPSASEPVGGAVGRIAFDLWRSMARRRKKVLAADAPPERLHRMRIRAKRLRYLLDGFRLALPEAPLREATRDLKRVQSVLGDFNDLEVQSASLRRYATEMAAEGMATPAALLAAGALAERLRRGRSETADRARERFSAFVSDETRDRFRAIAAGVS